MADSLLRYKQEKRDEIDFRIRLRQVCINSMYEPPPCSPHSRATKRKSRSEPNTPTKRSSPPQPKPKPQTKPFIVLSSDEEDTMDYEEHTRQLLKHAVLPTLDAHATPIPVATPLNHIYNLTPLERSVREVVKQQ